MLPSSSIALCMSSGKVRFRPDRGWEQAADDSADTVALGPSDAQRSVRTVRADTWSSGADQLPDRAAGRRRAQRPGDRLAGPAWAASGAQGAASVSGGGYSRIDAAQSAGTSPGSHAGLAGGVAASDRPGPTRGRG